MTKTRLSNREVSAYVTHCSDFVNNNKTLLGEMHRDGSDLWYVVYSYGHHWPLYVRDMESGKWYGNKDKYSTTTSKHLTVSRPKTDEIEWMGHYKIKHLADFGPMRFVLDALNRAI